MFVALAAMLIINTVDNSKTHRLIQELRAELAPETEEEKRGD
jgi:hypothetical protein